MRYSKILMFLMFNFLTSVLYANVVGSKNQNFNPSSNTKDFVTVYSSKTFGKYKGSMGLFINNATNTLPYFKSSNNSYEDDIPKKEYLNDMLLVSDLMFGLGITDNIDIWANIPILLYQYLHEKDSLHGEFASNGIMGIRVNTKINLLDNSFYGVAVIGSIYTDTIRHNIYNNTSYNLELALDTTLWDLDLGFNIGYRLWNASKSSELEENKIVKTNTADFISSAALGYMLDSWKTKILAEVYGAFPTNKFEDNSNRSKNSLESLVGIKYFSDNNLVYNVGYGTELIHGLSTPAWRVYAGIVWIQNINYNTSKVKITNNQKDKVQTKTHQGSSQDLPPIVMSNPNTLTKIDYSKPDEVIVWKDVLFKFDSDEFVNKKEAEESLKNILRTLKTNPNFKEILIEGHTCNIGSDKYNLLLSEKRAQKVRNLLIEKMSIDPAKITIKGFGETKPIAPNTTEYGRIKNRRVEFKIYR